MKWNGMDKSCIWSLVDIYVKSDNVFHIKKSDCCFPLQLLNRHFNGKMSENNKTNRNKNKNRWCDELIIDTSIRIKWRAQISFGLWMIACHAWFSTFIFVSFIDRALAKFASILIDNARSNAYRLGRTYFCMIAWHIHRSASYHSRVISFDEISAKFWYSFLSLSAFGVFARELWNTCFFSCGCLLLLFFWPAFLCHCWSSNHLFYRHFFTIIKFLIFRAYFSTIWS